MLRFLTAGESHGPGEVAILEGMPMGVPVSHADIQRELDKRKGGYGRGGRGKIETDEVKILSGVRFGKTLGSPIALLVENKDYANWQGKMDIELPNEIISKKETQPRPGHADLAGALKYQTDDIRNILERASARETVMRVAVGAVCKQFLLEFGIEIASHTLKIGSVGLDTVSFRTNVRNISQPNVGLHDIPRSAKQTLGMTNENYFKLVKQVFKTDPDLRCIDPEVAAKMQEEIRQTAIKRDTLGGVIEIIAHNVPVGLGSHVHWDRKLDGRIAHALMSIPSVKAVEIGNAIHAAGAFGSEVQDEIYFEKNRGYYRKTNRMGGIEGGMTNGEDVICRVYHKPISTLNSPLNTVDMATKQPTKALVERSDVCVIPRAGVISESMLAFVLAGAMLEKFGGDNISETVRNYKSFLKNIHYASMR